MREIDINTIYNYLYALEAAFIIYRVPRDDLKGKEIDFIAIKGDNRIYVQVAFRMDSQKTVDREFSPLAEIRDHHPKYVVTMEQEWHDNIDGIKHMHIADFLLGERVPCNHYPSKCVINYVT